MNKGWVEPAGDELSEEAVRRGEGGGGTLRCCGFWDESFVVSGRYGILRKRLKKQWKISSAYSRAFTKDLLLHDVHTTWKTARRAASVWKSDSSGDRWGWGKTEMEVYGPVIFNGSLTFMCASRKKWLHRPFPHLTPWQRVYRGRVPTLNDRKLTGRISETFEFFTFWWKWSVIFDRRVQQMTSVF